MKILAIILMEIMIVGSALCGCTFLQSASDDKPEVIIETPSIIANSKETPKPTESCQIYEDTIYPEYCDILEHMIQEFGWAERTEPVFTQEEQSQYPQASGLLDCLLIDLDNNETKELIVLYWSSWTELYVRLYTSVDSVPQILLEERIPEGPDNCRGIYLPTLNAPYLGIHCCDITGLQTGIPQDTVSFFSLENGMLKEALFQKLYSQKLSPSEPFPDDLMILYQIDNEEVSEIEYEKKMWEYAENTDRLSIGIKSPLSIMDEVINRYQ